MGLHTATRLNRWVKSAKAKTLHAGRLNIGLRLILGFVFIILSMLAADVVILWQFQVVRTQAGRLNDIDQKLVAVLRVHTSMLAFHGRLDGLADAEDADRLLIEAGPLRTAVLEDIRRATSALSLPLLDSRRDPTILPTLYVIQSALPSELEAITTLAASGDWRAVHLRLTNQVRPLEYLASALVEKVEHAASEQQAETVLNIRRVRRLVFLIVPLTAVFTLLIAGTLGLAITRSITQPLARLVEGSKALARGEFQHQVSVTGKDELAHLGQVFNDTARRLQDLYATLQQSEAYLAEAQRLSKTGSFGWSVSTGEIRWSEETFRIFQYDRTTKPTIELILQRLHPEDAALVKQTIERASQDGKDFDHEYRLVMPDRSVKYVHVVAHSLSDESGGIEFFGAVMDTTESHRVEEALRRSESYLAEPQRLTHTGSWAWQVAGSVALHLSEEWYRLYGFDPEKSPPTREERVQRVHPEDRAKWQGAVDRAIAETSGFEMEFRILLPDGTVKYIHTVGHPVLNASGDLVEFVGSSTDITERKRAEEALEALRQAQADLARVNRVTTMGELTASLAHVVNQPTAAAVTNANTCLRWLAGNTPNLKEARAAAMRIVKDGTRAGEIISRIRLLFKKGTPERELVDVSEVIREMIVLLRSEAMRYSISVRTELAEDLPQVLGDRVQLQQVLMNLIMNSIDAMKDVEGTRELVIKSQNSGNEHLLVSVSDTGVGLPPHQADQIFNAFFTTKPDGTGMGLRISRSIVESHGGRLWAADNSPRGASFYLTLPAKVEARE